ncbi:hypothetical protein ACFHWS_17775 [Micromonospora sp. LOL_013]|uniref:hypothetical protein n=1 Tax=unclassified Micromonospora TaxID=2617518 RepID=UPI003A85C689
MRAADDPLWHVREVPAYWRAMLAMRIFLLASLVVGVSVLALLLGGPVAVFRPVLELMFVVFAAAMVLHWSAIRPVYRHIHQIPELAATDIFERGPKLFGLVVRDLFDLRSWRPPR